MLTYTHREPRKMILMNLSARQQWRHRHKEWTYRHRSGKERVGRIERVALKHALPHVKFFSSVAQLCLILCNPMDCSTPGFPVHHQLLQPTQTHVHLVGDAIQPTHPLLSTSPLAFNLSQHQGLFQWVSSLHQVVKVLELQLQHQSFPWIFMTDFL